MADFAPHQLTDQAWRVLTCAREEAVRLKAAAVDTPHLLLALARLEDDAVGKAFQALGVALPDIVRVAEALSAAADGEVPRPLPLSAQATAGMEGALLASKLLTADRVDASHVLLGVLKAGGGAGEALERAGLRLPEARARVFEALRVPVEARVELGGAKPEDALDDAQRAVAEVRAAARREREGPDPPRALPARELTSLAERVKPADRDRELAKLEEVLTSGERRSLFLIGPPGCGKRAIVRAYAGRLAEQAGPGCPRQQVYLFEPEMARSCAPPIFMGEGAVVGRWLAELLARAEAGVFAFSHFVSDEWVYDDFIEFVIPACVRRWATCLFLVTLEERRELGRRHPELSSVTLEMEIAPLSPSHAQEVVAQRARLWPKSEHITIADTAVEAVVNLARKYVTSRALPGSACELLDRVRARVQREYAPRLPDFAKSIDAVQRKIKEAAERGAFDEAASLRRERDERLREYDERLEKLQAERGVIVIGTGEIVKAVAEMTGKSEEEIRAGGVWK